MFEPPTSADLAASNANDAQRRINALEHRVAQLEREVLTLKEQQRVVNGTMMDLIAKVARHPK